LHLSITYYKVCKICSFRYVLVSQLSVMVIYF